MLQCSVTPRDDKPYIFISYAHADKKQVYPIIEELDRRGYRVWYDKGIVPGKKWPEVIGRHVIGCTMMLVFISPEFAKSDHCQRELTLAQDKKKLCLGAMLRATDMTAGLEYQMALEQRVARQECPSDMAFIDRICQCSEMVPCLEEKQPEETYDLQDSGEKNREPPKEEMLPQLKDPRLFKILRTVCLVGILLLVLAVVLACCDALKQIDITEDQTAFLDTSMLLLDDDHVTADVIRNINRLTKLSDLTFKGCTFENGALALLDIPHLSFLNIVDSEGIDDLSFLSKMHYLRGLDMTNSGLTDEIMIEANLPELEYLYFSNNPQWADLSCVSDWSALRVLEINDTGVFNLAPVKKLELRHLEFSNTAVSDLTPLAGQTELTSVIGSNTAVTDITPLAGLTKLHTLDFSLCDVIAPEVVFQSLRLEKLFLCDCAMEDLSAFANCTILKEVNVSSQFIRDISVLEKSAATLEQINVANSNLSYQDLSFMENCPNLLNVRVDGIELADLYFLSGASKLMGLSATDCQLTSISGLHNLVNLISLDLSGYNKIENLFPLYTWSREEPVYLDLSDNPLEDVTWLPDLEYSYLGLRCDSLDPGTMPAISGEHLELFYSDTILDSHVADKTFSRITIYDCPPDRQVALEDHFGDSLELLQYGAAMQAGGIE